MDVSESLAPMVGVLHVTNNFMQYIKLNSQG
jgi:hypothetical protein